MVDAWIQDAITRYEGPLVRYAARIVGADRARDVVQDTFERLFEADRASVDGRVPEWLYTVCRNRALDVVRKESRRAKLSVLAPPVEPAASPHETAERRELLRRALDAVERLPAKQAEVLRLKLRDGLSYAQIAERTGLKTGYVGYLLHHGLKAVRAELAGDR